MLRFLHLILAFALIQLLASCKIRDPEHSDLKAPCVANTHRSYSNPADPCLRYQPQFNKLLTTYGIA